MIHIILRGSKHGPNYSDKHVSEACNALRAAKLPGRLMVDCSHGNSQKLHSNQKLVAADIASQLSAGSSQVMGVMVESNIVEGRQDVGADPKALVYLVLLVISFEGNYLMLNEDMDRVLRMHVFLSGIPFTFSKY